MNIAEETFQKYQDVTSKIKIDSNQHHNVQIHLHFIEDLLNVAPEFMHDVIKHEDGTIQLNKILTKTALVDMSITTDGLGGRLVFYSIEELETFLKNNKYI